MPVPPQHRDSYAPVVKDVQYSWSDPPEWTPLPVRDCFRSLNLKYGGSEAVWKGTLSLFDPAGLLLEGNILSPLVNAHLRLNWNWESGGFTRGLTPYYRARVTKVTPEYANEGVMLQVELIGDVTKGTSVSEVLLDVTTPPRAFGSMPVSTIVEYIAAARGWDAVIQPTNGTVEQIMIPASMNHISFIREMLLPMAVAKGQGGDPYVFYFDRDGVLHFHSYRYAFDGGDGTGEGSGGAGNYPTLTGDYVYYGDIAGNVISFEPSDASAFAVMAGGGDAVHATVDSAGGEPVEVESTLAAGMNGEGVGRIHQEEVRFPPIRSGVNASPKYIYHHFFAGDTRDNRRDVFYAALRNHAFRATLVLKGTHAHRPQDTVRVRYFDAYGEKGYLGGYWTVLEVEHTLEQTWTTTLTLIRKGLAFDAGGADVSLSGEEYPAAGEGSGS